MIELPTPDAAIVAKRGEIVKALEALVGPHTIISDAVGLTAFETDALTAYRCMPLAVVLPTSTEEVSKVLRYAHAEGIKVVARGAGTSLCGGALPLEDSIVVGVSKMNTILEIDYENRFARVEAGITNLAISNATAPRGFFYAPDPSSQIACTLAGNIAMNSGGAHCLKYGVTTNNILGVKMVLMNGDIVELGGTALDSEGYDLLALVIGSEGQFGIVTEATVRILPAGRRRAPHDDRLRIERQGRHLRGPPSLLPASSRWPSNSWTSRPSRSARRSPRRAIRSERGSAAHHRGRRLRRRDLRLARPTSLVSPKNSRAKALVVELLARAERAHLEGPQIRLRCHRPHR